MAHAVVKPPLKLTLRAYEPGLASCFKEINEAWIREMFVLESKDLKVLNDPKTEIIEQGGEIWFVEAGDQGIVGTCALLKTGPGEYELTKMGVLKHARGIKAGEFLLKALIQRAEELGATNLYLLTNRKCEAAIHLYEKFGFVHDEPTMRRFGPQYERCDVAMRYSPPCSYVKGQSIRRP